MGWHNTVMGYLIPTTHTDTHTQEKMEDVHLVGMDYTLSDSKIRPVVTNRNLSSSSVTSSSSTFLPGKKNPIILLKNWYINWMVSGTTFTWWWKQNNSIKRTELKFKQRRQRNKFIFTSKCSLTEIPPTGGRTLLKIRKANWRPAWQVLWGRRTTF